MMLVEYGEGEGGDMGGMGPMEFDVVSPVHGALGTQLTCLILRTSNKVVGRVKDILLVVSDLLPILGTPWEVAMALVSEFFSTFDDLAHTYD